MSSTTQRPVRQLRYHWQDDHPWSSLIQMGLWLGMMLVSLLPLIGLAPLLAVCGLHLKKNEGHNILFLLMMCQLWLIRGVSALKWRFDLSRNPAKIIQRKGATTEVEFEPINSGDSRSYQKRVQKVLFASTVGWVCMFLFLLVAQKFYETSFSVAFIIVAVASAFVPIGVNLIALHPTLLRLLPCRIDVQGITTHTPRKTCFVPWHQVETCKLERSQDELTGQSVLTIRLRDSNGKTLLCNTLNASETLQEQISQNIISVLKPF